VVVKEPTLVDSPRTALRKKFSLFVDENLRVFHNMKKEISFLEFVADINRLRLDLSEVQARALFKAVDPHDTGFIKSAALVRYAKSGNSNYREPVERPKTSFDGPVNELLTQVIGNNTLGEQ
jgi:Ca2+-binding EF-hand superfamily protein